MLLPKFVYTSPAVTFEPTWPAMQKSAQPKIQREGNDTYSTAGVRQSITLRLDHLWTLDFNFVPASDISGWTALINYAITGNPFDYYPDKTSGTHDTYTLDDTDFDPKYAAQMGYYKFSITLRKQIL